MKIADVGEHKLLQVIYKYCPKGLVGDDAAILAPMSDSSLVVTTDVLVDKVHFSEITTSPFDVGWRGAAANLSDIAAMGASPLGITVGLGLPSDVDISWVDNLYQGMTACLQRHNNTPIVGGDLVRSRVIFLAITAFGQVCPTRIIRRNCARVGDAIIVTGQHGASRGGLELLLNPEIGSCISYDDQQVLINSHLRPKPRLDVIEHLWEVLSSESLMSVAGMDSSDGLADTIQQICHHSGVGAVIEIQNITFPSVFHQWLSKDKIWEYVFYGGEDFQLVLCLAPKAAQQLVQKLNQDAAIIGKITEGTKIILQDIESPGKYPDLVLSRDRGFQHFAN